MEVRQVSKCEAVQYSDQMVCAKCVVRWDVNDPAPPACGKQCEEIRQMSSTRDYPAFETDHYGMTKREYAAVHLLGSIIVAAGAPELVGRDGIKNAVFSAVGLADALFNELERG
jgi:hypothetical protein